MATFGKKEREKKRLKKKKDKAEKKEERKGLEKSGKLDDMIAYVDEFGNITDTPPDPTVKKKKIDAKSIEIGIPKSEKVAAETEFSGKVDYFDHSKGFGFIKTLDGVDKYFVHVNGLIDDVEEGDKVIFELEKGMRGMNAVKVKKT